MLYRILFHRPSLLFNKLVAGIKLASLMADRQRTLFTIWPILQNCLWKGMGNFFFREAHKSNTTMYGMQNCVTISGDYSSWIKKVQDLGSLYASRMVLTLTDEQNTMVAFWLEIVDAVFSVLNRGGVNQINERIDERFLLIFLQGFHLQFWYIQDVILASIG